MLKNVYLCCIFKATGEKQPTEEEIFPDYPREIDCQDRTCHLTFAYNEEGCYILDFSSAECDFCSGHCPGHLDRTITTCPKYTCQKKPDPSPQPDPNHHDKKMITALAGKTICLLNVVCLLFNVIMLQ